MKFYVWETYYRTSNEAQSFKSNSARHAAELYAKNDQASHHDDRDDWTVMVGETPRGPWDQYYVTSHTTTSFHAQEDPQ